MCYWSFLAPTIICKCHSGLLTLAALLEVGRGRSRSSLCWTCSCSFHIGWECLPLCGEHQPSSVAFLGRLIWCNRGMVLELLRFDSWFLFVLGWWRPQQLSTSLLFCLGLGVQPTSPSVRFWGCSSSAISSCWWPLSLLVLKWKAMEDGGPSRIGGRYALLCMCVVELHQSRRRIWRSFLRFSPCIFRVSPSSLLDFMEFCTPVWGSIRPLGPWRLHTVILFYYWLQV